MKVNPLIPSLSNIIRVFSRTLRATWLQWNETATANLQLNNSSFSCNHLLSAPRMLFWLQMVLNEKERLPNQADVGHPLINSAVITGMIRSCLEKVAAGPTA